MFVLRYGHEYINRVISRLGKLHCCSGGPTVMLAVIIVFIFLVIGIDSFLAVGYAYSVLAVIVEFISTPIE